MFHIVIGIQFVVKKANSSLNPNTQQKEMYSKRNFAIFPALDITIAPRQQSNKYERNITDGLTLASTTCTHSARVER